MTLAVSWIRKIGDKEELFFASDSGPRSYNSWEVYPKIFSIENTNCVIAFAGDDRFSHPFITQIQLYAETYHRSYHESLEVHQLKDYLIDTLNYTPVHRIDPIRFLFGGYCHQKGKFFLWNICYNKYKKQFSTAEVHWKDPSQSLSIIGDYHFDYLKRLVEVMKAKNKFYQQDLEFDMEPFEVLRDMIKEREFEDIGGPPQLLRIHDRVCKTPVSVKWKTVKGEIPFLLGRPLLEYERPTYPTLDPYTLEIDYQLVLK